MNHRIGFISVYILTTALALAAAITVNVLGNASNIFPSPIVPAQSERAWKTRKIDQLVADGHAPQIVIMGSSRVLRIEPSHVSAVTGKTTFNYGVYEGTPIDFAAQLAYLSKVDCRPELLIVGIDEFAFRSNFKQFDMQSLGHLGLFEEIPWRTAVDYLWHAFRQCTLQSTVSSCLRLLHLSAPESANDVKNVFLDDGSIDDSQNVFEPSRLPATIDSDIRRGFIEGSIKTSFFQPDQRKFQQFENLLASAQRQRIDLCVVFMPLHPDYEKRVFNQELADGRTKLHEWLQKSVEQHGGRYWNCADLAAFDGDPDQFIDSMHMTNANSRRLIDVVLGLSARDANSNSQPNR
jgi:hypothetical protein